jgi:hypothetical protein
VKRALLVGIDEYDNFSPLAGCVNDVRALTPLVARNEDTTLNFSTQELVSGLSRVTGDRLKEAVQALLAPGADVALFYFAGHGAEKANDVVLATQDGTATTPGYPVAELLASVATSPIREINIVLDCCFSGAAGEVPQLGSSLSSLRPGVTVLTASRGDQTSAETPEGRGLFSVHFGAALEGGAADVLGTVSMAGIYAYLSESFGAWDQRPTFKANIDRAHELRRCAPAVPLSVLQALPVYFPTADHEFRLDPSYEPDAEPANPEHEAVFDQLQRCRAAKLVEPVGSEHMYFAAMEDKSCRLTPLGRHYRAMAAGGLL